MKIQKSEVILIVACAIAGFVFLLFPTNGNLTAALFAGLPSGALGGCVAAIFRRLIKNHHKGQQNQALHATSEPAPGAASSSHEG